ncbi:MAG: HNH endonuclease [Thermaurantiacus sp.]
MSVTDDLAQAGEWEEPVYKMLTRNDSGQRAGHQAGFLVPKDIAHIFPASEVRFTAILRIGDGIFGVARPRFQTQTWGGTRPGERRITDLGAWDRETAAGDVVLIERSVTTDLLYRITLLRQGSAEHDLFRPIFRERWGRLSSTVPKVSYDEIRNAEQEIVQSAILPFNAIEQRSGVRFTRRLARARAFARIVLGNYRDCAMCGGALALDDRIAELEAAHIIPVAAGGTDDPRNGIGLCRAHHWAFDRGFLSVSPDRAVLVADAAVSTRLFPLLALRDRVILEPADPRIAPHPDALAWHRNEVFGRLRTVT